MVKTAAFAVLKGFAKAAARVGLRQYFGTQVGLAGDIGVEAAVDYAEKGVDWVLAKLWFKETGREALQSGVPDLLNTASDDVRQMAEEVLSEELPKLADDDRARLVERMCMIPDLMRQSIAVPDGHGGSVLKAGVRFDSELDLQKLVPPAGSLLPGERIANNRFEIVRRLGVGGMGEVYLVKDLRLGNDAALKIIRADLIKFEEIRRQFDAEIALCKKLNHENIVRVFDLGEDLARGIEFFTMEFVEGRTLREWMQSLGRRVTLDEFKTIAEAVCGGLSYAHRHTLHRDLKPENIMVADDLSTIKLLDFGLAKLFGGKATRMTHAGSGTLSYMSPEQEDGRNVDQRSDLYSLGVICYELLTGQRPRGRWRSASSHNGSIPASVSAAIDRALDTDPDDRFADVAAFAAALFAAPAAPTAPKAPAEPKSAQPQSKTAPKAEQPAPRVLDLGDGEQIQLVRIPAGTFQMGSRLTPEQVQKKYGGDIKWFKDEHPRHAVTLSRAFDLAVHPVTVGQFRRFVEEADCLTDAEKGGQSWENGQTGGYTVNDKLEWGRRADASWRSPGFDQDGRHPVVLVSWNDAQAYCQWLSERSKRAVRLPTEAEWEYACRAGAETEYWWGDDPDRTGKVANVADRTFKKKWPNASVMDMDDGYVFTSPVGTYQANKFELHDMIGNVWEWCSDWLGEYPKSAVKDPTGPANGDHRVLRGGSWHFFPSNCRSAFRNRLRPANRNYVTGFRVAAGT